MNAVAPRWERRPETRRDELLDAATRLLQHQPLSAIKVSDITEAAGTSKGTFYTYFASKEALYTALNQRYLDGLIAAMDEAAAMPGLGDWFERHDASLAAVIGYMYERTELIEVWEREGANSDPAQVFSTGLSRIASALAASIEEEVAAGRICCQDPMATALLVSHGIDGIVSDDLTGREQLGQERVVDAVQAMFRALVARSSR
jgi:AcrR family transcriptional regulator